MNSHRVDDILNIKILGKYPMLMENHQLGLENASWETVYKKLRMMVRNEGLIVIG